MEVVINWPRPETVKDVRLFLELSNHYRKLIKQYFLLARPLTDLTKWENMRKCGEAEQKAFDEIKVSLATASILRFPDFDRPLSQLRMHP